jgi:Zn-dependent peptidase ImmA (M78 family)/DNA-binding XRE family transcriptional regulator
MATNILDKIDMSQLGELLQQARKQCGMTQAEAAKVIDAARTTMVAIEKGQRRLKASELIKLARAYGRAVSDFVRQEPVLQPFEVQFRAAYRRSELEELQIEPVIRHFEELCRNYLELEQLVGAPLPRNYPQEYQVMGMPIEQTAESLAVAERQRIGLGDSPVPMLRDILEQGVGLRIFYIPMPAKYSEIYNYDESLGGCLAINANHPEERRRWSLAHGYLHFLAHRRKPIFDFEGQYQRMPESEKLAEAFAKYFLMPTSSLLKRFNEICQNQRKFTPTNLFTLAHFYGVSLQALVYRLEEMELLPSGTWERLSERGLKVREVQQQLGLEEIPQRPDKFPIYYKNLAIVALDLGSITEGHFANLMGVERLEARLIAEKLREYSSEIREEVQNADLRQVQ